jgi:uncharacterized RDD family membrane protein YckC
MISMQSLRWPRLAAGLIDFAPFAIALWLVTPLLVTLGLVAYESRIGVGIFDPATGQDPVLAAHLNGQRPLALGVLVGALGWIVVEVLMLARQQASLGQGLCGLLLLRRDGQPATLARRLVRGSVRQLLVLMLIVTATIAARPGLPSEPRRYWDYAANPPAPPLFSAEQVGPLALWLTGALLLALAVDLVLLLADARSLGDRLAGTALRRRS